MIRWVGGRWRREPRQRRANGSSINLPDAELLGSDGRGGLVVARGGDVFVVGVDGTERLTSGELVAIAADTAYVRECRYAWYFVDTTRGQSSVVAAFEPDQPVVWSADARFAAMISDSRLLVFDRAGGELVPCRHRGSEQSVRRRSSSRSLPPADPSACRRTLIAAAPSPPSSPASAPPAVGVPCRTGRAGSSPRRARCGVPSCSR